MEDAGCIKINGTRSKIYIISYNNINEKLTVSCKGAVCVFRCMGKK